MTLDRRGGFVTSKKRDRLSPLGEGTRRSFSVFGGAKDSEPCSQRSHGTVLGEKMSSSVQTNLGRCDPKIIMTGMNDT